MNPQDELTPDEAAAVVTLRRATLDRMRCRGGGPAYIKRNNRVLYRRADLLEWLEQRTTQHGEVAR